MGRLASFKDSENRITVERLRCTCLLRFSPCYKTVAHLKEKNALRYCLPPMKGRLAAEDVPALFLITVRGLPCRCGTESRPIKIAVTMKESNPVQLTTTPALAASPCSTQCASTELHLKHEPFFNKNF